MRKIVFESGHSAKDRGVVHGKTFAGDIGKLADIRIFLASKMSGLNEKELLSYASDHLPVLEKFDSDLYEELLGIAEGAEVSAEKVVVLNHYTDIRDLGRSLGKKEKNVGDFDGGCTILYDKTENGPVFAQTWDMHASSIPYVIMMWCPDGAGGGAWVLSLTGCLGMAGMSKSRTFVGINNLTSKDAKIGVVWSAIVRKALRQSTAKDSFDCVWNADIGSGHHYVVGDRDNVYAIESSGQKRKVISKGESLPYVHANHCLDDEIGSCNLVPNGSTTFERQEIMETLAKNQPIKNGNDAWKLLSNTKGFPRSISTNMTTPENPHGTATCAGLVMIPKTGVVKSAAGFTHSSNPQDFNVEDH